MDVVAEPSSEAKAADSDAEMMTDKEDNDTVIAKHAKPAAPPAMSLHAATAGAMGKQEAAAGAGTATATAWTPDHDTKLRAAVLAAGTDNWTSVRPFACLQQRTAVKGIQGSLDVEEAISITLSLNSSDVV